LFSNFFPAFSLFFSFDICYYIENPENPDFADYDDESQLSNNRSGSNAMFGKPGHGAEVDSIRSPAGPAHCWRASPD